jgi:hypothetical protein
MSSYVHILGLCEGVHTVYTSWMGEKIDMRSDVIDNCPCIKHFKNKEIVPFVHYDATKTHGWVQK